MKKLLLLLSILLICSNSFSQKKVMLTFDTALGDMKASIGTDKALCSVNGLNAAGDENPGFYRWDASSTATDNGFTVISVEGASTGRWMRVGASNTIKGTTTLSGALLTTSYFVSFNATLPFVPITVVYTPRSSAAAQVSWIPSVNGITNTGFTISYFTVPVIGTQNMIIDWIAFKQ